MVVIAGGAMRIGRGIGREEESYFDRDKARLFIIDEHGPTARTITTPETSLMADIERLIAVEAINLLKARHTWTASPGGYEAVAA